jgi:transcription antitermination factor NusG
MLYDPCQAERSREGLSRGWYALYTRHRHEKAVAKALTAKGLAVFLPLYSAPRQWKDRTKVIMLPLFSCYVFIQGSLDRHLDVVSTAGVHGFVCCAGLPACIPQAEIDGVRQVVERSIKIEPHPFIRCGDRVRVKAGPLEGIEGILIRKKNFSRLVLTVELLGKSAAVEVDVSLVERTNTPGISRSSGARRGDRIAFANAESSAYGIQFGLAHKR